MKKIFTCLAYLVLITALSPVSFPQVWRAAFTPNSSGVYGIYFVNPSLGWCAGLNGLIRKTTDGGLTWSEVYTDTAKKTLNGIYFLDENNGYAVGNAATILKTTDGGSTWNRITNIGISGDVNAVHFISVNEGWVVADLTTGSAVFRTSDGGTSWTQVFSSTNLLYNLYFAEGTHGVVSGKSCGDLYYTSDGINWTQAAKPSLGGITYSRSDLWGVTMVTSNIGYASGWGSSAVGLEPTMYFKTTDGGATWSYMPQDKSNWSYDNVYKLWFKDSENGFAVGGGSRTSLVTRTTDGGQNWSPVSIPSGGAVKAIYGIGNIVWVANTSGAILKSTDFGNTWKLMDLYPTEYLYSMQIVSNNIFYTAGSNGYFLKSTNSGKDWHASYVRIGRVCPNIQNLFFLNDKTGFAAQSYGLSGMTTDGGDTWKAMLPDTTAVTVVNYDVNFIDANKGFVVGKLGTGVDVIYKTTDGGAAWDTKTSTVQATLRAIAFADANNGAVVAEKLRGIYTTDGGATWNTSKFNSVPSSLANANLKDVAFSNGLNGVAVGTGITLKTTDGGANWNYVDMPGLADDLTGVAFNKNSVGYAVGKKSSAPKNIGIYKTTDNGSTWVNTSDTTVINTSETIYGVAVDNDGNPWVTSSKSIYTTAAITDVEGRQDNVPQAFELSQNYPNPFNPSTVINYSVPKESRVSIRVYNIIGEEVAVLVNELKSAGNYSVKFSAAGYSSSGGNSKRLASGIYFYQLKAAPVDGRTGDIRITKKMLMIK